MQHGSTSGTAVRGPWGALATVFFTGVAGALFFLVQLAVIVLYVAARVARTPDLDLRAVAAGLDSDGLLFGLAELVAAPVTIGFVFLLAWARKGPPVRDYLALRPASRSTTLRWLLYTALLLAALDRASVLAGYPVVPDWMKEIYRTAHFPMLLFFAIVVLAPVFEELLFRGFVFEGLRRSRLGVTGTIVLASAAWACVHLQYEWFYVGQIFGLGVLLGVARAQADSVVLPILMHSVSNGIASIQMILESQA